MALFVRQDPLYEEIRRSVLHLVDPQLVLPHRNGMAQSITETPTWPDLAIGLYDKLTGRGAEITYEFHSMEVAVPSSASGDAQHATWRLNGTMKIRTKDETSAARG